MPKPRQPNTGETVSQGKKVVEGTFGSYLATNFEQEVAALNRAGAKSAQPNVAAGPKINGIVVASAAVIVVSIVGVIVMANLIMGGRDNQQTTQPEEPQLQFHRTVQGKEGGFSTRKKYQIERPPSFQKTEAPRRKFSVRRRPASVD